MNLKKIKSHTKKIDKLCKVLESSQDQISSIERDLLLTYIRNLYEEVLNMRPQKSDEKSKNTAPVEIFHFEDTKKAVAEIRETSTPEEKKVDHAIVQSVPEKVVERIKPEDSPVKVQQTSTENIEIPAASKAPNIDHDVNAEVYALFEVKEATELSERLSQLPIKNLKSAIGINEKIFTTNELFGGSNKLFNDAITQIDNMTSFEDARDYLVADIAIANDWSSPVRKKKAQNLIKLIKRRFS